MRSWLENINAVVVGNIINESWKENSETNNYEIYKENPLKYIWENRFNKYRFESFECCKDKCKNKCVEIKLARTKQEKDNIFEKELDKFTEKQPAYPPYRIVLYGVSPGIVKVYGVVYPNQGTYVYACPSDWHMTTSMYAVKTLPSTCDDNNTVTKTTI
jgi:hypothetical protein